MCPLNRGTISAVFYIPEVELCQLYVVLLKLFMNDLSLNNTIKPNKEMVQAPRYNLEKKNWNHMPKWPASLAFFLLPLN